MDLKSQQTLLRARLRARDAEIEAFVVRLERLLAGATRELAARADKDGIRSLAGFERTLQEAGLSNELRRLRSVYAEELKVIQEQFKASGIQAESIYTDVDRDIVETLITQDFEKVGATLNQYGTTVKSTLARQVLTGIGPSIDAVLTERTARNIRTELDTATAGFSRTVTVKKAVDLLGDNPRFSYMGARPDGVIRPFCKQLLISRTPPIYTLSEIKAMDNGQGIDVLTYGGGFNCRHEWVPVTDRTIESLYGN